MVREKIKMHEGIIKIAKGGNKGLRTGINGTRAEEEMQRLRWKTKGADSAKGRNKMHDGEHSNLKGEIKDKTGTKAEEENTRLREKFKGADSATES